MVCDKNFFRISRRILLSSCMIAILASEVSAQGTPGQNGQGRNNDPDAQRTQQYDQLQQLQQQQQDLRNMDVSQRSFALNEELPFILWQIDAERARLKEQLRANFRRHYAIIRKNTDDLIQLTSSLESDIENSGNQPLTRETIEKTEKMQTLAHEVLDQMAGRKLPKPKPAPAAASSTAVGIGIADHQRVLNEKISDAKATATRMKKAVDDYLAGDNTQAVSVSALQKTSDREHFDPNSVAIISATVKLQRLADEIRSEMRMVNVLR
jgi:hypothetical protein